MEVVKRKISVFSLAMVSFIATFGFSNVFNNYQVVGPSVVWWWVGLCIILAIFTFMFVEMASANPESSSGIYIWSQRSLGSRFAFLVSWSYFVANVFYIPTLLARIPTFLSWVYGSYGSLSQVDRNDIDLTQFNIITDASSHAGLYLFYVFLTLLVITFAVIFFESHFEKATRITGTVSLGISVVFVLLAVWIFIKALLMREHTAYEVHLSDFRPYINKNILTTFGWMIFAIGGTETIGVVCNQVSDSRSKIVKALTLSAVLIGIGYIICSLALTLVIPQSELQGPLLQLVPVSFAKLGEQVGFGAWFLRLVMFGFFFLTVVAAGIWSAVNVKTLLSQIPQGELPDFLRKTNRYGTPVQAMLVQIVFILVMMLIIALPSVVDLPGLQQLKNLYDNIYNLATLALTIPFILLPLAYMGYKLKDIPTAYKLSKTPAILMAILGFGFGVMGAFFIADDFSLDDAARHLWLMQSVFGMLAFLVLGYILRWLSLRWFAYVAKRA